MRVVETQKFIARSTSKYVARLFIDIVKCFFMYFNVLWGSGSSVCFLFVGVFILSPHRSHFLAWGSLRDPVWNVCYTTHIKKREYKFFYSSVYEDLLRVCSYVLNYGAFAYSLIIYFDYVIYLPSGFPKKYFCHPLTYLF